MPILNQWIPFDSKLLSKKQLKIVNKYCEITNQTPVELYFLEMIPQVTISFKNTIYQLTKNQMVKISKLDFKTYTMCDITYSHLVLENYPNKTI